MKSRQLKSSNKESLHLPIHAYLGYLLVCTLLLTGVSFSRYISSASGSDSPRVAAGVVTVSYDGDTTVEMDRPTDPNNQIETAEFSFHVSNSASEVAIQYDLVLALDQPLPNGVTISLYKNGGSDPIGTFDNNIDSQFTVSNAGIFKAGSQEIDQYKLTFEGDFDTISEDYNRTVSISVQAEQID